MLWSGGNQQEVEITRQLVIYSFKFFYGFPDQTCVYDVILHGYGRDDMLVKENSDRDENLYYHEYKNLTYNSEYSFAVRGVNDEYYTESRESWLPFKTPSCIKLHNDTSKCGPEPIENISAKLLFVKGHSFNVNVSWNETNHKPDFYTLEILDVNPVKHGNDSSYIARYIINKVSQKRSHLSSCNYKSSYKLQNDTSIFIKNITIKGADCWINLTAHLNNFTISDDLFIHVAHLKSYETNNTSLFIPSLMFAVFIIILICCTLFICKMKNQLRQKPLENIPLDLIKSINDRSLMIADLKGDEFMEIPKEAIEIDLNNELGKGAFGVVKRATLRKDGVNMTVAVKMLKGKIRNLKVTCHSLYCIVI